MIDKIILGFLNTSMHVIEWFLGPLTRALANTQIGQRILDASDNFIAVCNMVDSVMLWVVDATGIPRPMLTILGAILFSCITLRFQCYLFKMIVKWWDRIIA